MTETKSVLLVDDHGMFRNALARVLDWHPRFRVVNQAGTLAEARRLAARDGFDIVIVDLFLPDGSGMDLVRELRRVKRRAALLLLTISLNYAQHVQAIEDGADIVLDKSASLDEIIGAVEHLVDKKSNERNLRGA